MNATAEVLGRGVYPLAEAARMSHLPPRTVRRWMEGYDYTHKGERRRSEPISYLAYSYYQPGVAHPAKKSPTPILDSSNC